MPGRSWNSSVRATGLRPLDLARGRAMLEGLQRIPGRICLPIRLKFTVCIAASLLACGILSFWAASPFVEQAASAGDLGERVRGFQCVMAGMVLAFLVAGTAGALVFSRFIS